MDKKNSKKVSTSGLANAACVPKVFDFKDIFHLCTKKIDSETIKIMLRMKKISLNAKTSRQIFKLPEANILFPLSEAHSFAISKVDEDNVIANLFLLNY